MKRIKEEREYFAEDENIYSDEGREVLLEEGELSPEEEAFMRGYDEAGQVAIRNLLGLGKTGITDLDIMEKLHEAHAKNLDEIEFITPEGDIVKVRLPRMFEGS